MRTKLWALCCLLTITCTGCGLSTYEERLKATEDLYSYLQLQNTNLASPTWERRDLDLSLRVPLPFRNPLPPEPKLPPDADPSTIVMSSNPLGVALPGLVETWKTSLPNSTGFADDAYLFVLTNHDRFLTAAEGGPTPSAFLNELEALLSAKFGIAIPEGESANQGDNIRYRVRAPLPNSPHSQYTNTKDYSAIRYVPAGQPYQAWLFERRAGDVQAAILVVCPQSANAQFRQRMNLSLETFGMSNKVPRTATSGGSGGTSRPSTGGTSGF